MSNIINITPVSDVPAWWVTDEYESGFAFEPDDAVAAATASLILAEATGFDAALSAARALAAADAASPLTRANRAKLGAAVLVEWPGRDGLCGSIGSSATYSKRCKAGRATDDEVLSFLMVCDHPSLDKLYNYLPKDAKLAKPKGTGRRAAADESADDETPVSKPETVATVTDADCPKIAADVLAGLTTRGLTRAQVSLVIAELDRLTTPVASVKAA